MYTHFELGQTLNNSIFSDYLAGVIAKEIPGNPFECKMIKIGDGLDFGNLNLSLRALWKGLQGSNSKLITRLIGRRAFYQMMGLCHHLGEEAISGFAQEVIEEVKSGSLLAVYAHQGVLYSYAGLDMDFFPEHLGVGVEEIATNINSRFLALVLKVAALPTDLPPEVADQKRVALYHSEPLFAQLGIFEGTEDINNPWFKQVTVKKLTYVG
jgi:hypothetical protein